MLNFLYHVLAILSYTNKYSFVTGTQGGTEKLNIMHYVTCVYVPLLLYHPGIRGNELADEAAKAALCSTVSTMKCPASDFIPELTSPKAEPLRSFLLPYPCHASVDVTGASS